MTSIVDGHVHFWTPHKEAPKWATSERAHGLVRREMGPAALSRAMADSLELPVDAVRVLLHEYPAGHWGRGGQLVSDIREKEAT